MECEPRWGDGRPTSDSARVERSPHLAARFARVDPPPPGEDKIVASPDTAPDYPFFTRPRIITSTAAVNSTAMQP